MGSSRYELIESSFFPLWGIYMGCSRKFADLALIELTGFDKADVVPSVDGVPPEQQALPFRAVWEPGNTLEKERAETLNTPYPFPVPFPGRSRSTIILNWLGCRCSWPMTQFMCECSPCRRPPASRLTGAPQFMCECSPCAAPPASRRAAPAHLAALCDAARRVELHLLQHAPGRRDDLDAGVGPV